MPGTSPGRATPENVPELWPDPVGSERWYGFAVYIPSNFVLATDMKWFTFTQFKQQNGGSPTHAKEIQGENFRLGGIRTDVSNSRIPNGGRFGAIDRGEWTVTTPATRSPADGR